jgi:hypothetical protein
MKSILIIDGWKLRRRDEFNWLLAKENKYTIVPRKCKTLPFAIFDQILVEAGLQGRYLELLELARLNQRGVQREQDQDSPGDYLVQQASESRSSGSIYSSQSHSPSGELATDSLRDDRHHETVDAHSFCFGLRREFHVERAR